MRDVLPFIVIVGILFLKGRSLPTRASLVDIKLAFAPKPRNVLNATLVLSGLALLGIFFLIERFG